MWVNKPMKIRLGFCAVLFSVLLAVLYLEEWFAVWFPKSASTIGSLFLMTALGGGYLWSLTLPHPRRERKQREALAKLGEQVAKDGEAYWNSPEGIARLKAHDEETLAEKRP